jgi:SAM-dependent methyltransferase
MEPDATCRFSSRVEDYIRYRPSYPVEIVSLLERDCALTAAARIADIGSGTGFLSSLFLNLGCEVFGVEPNPEMRAAGERLLAGELRYHSVDGRAEATGLDPASVDFVTAGQAFHWFHRTAARAEFARILRPPGWVVLVWNERLVEGRFLEALEALLVPLCDYTQIDHRRMDNTVMDEFFGAGKWRLAEFPNQQLFDLTGLLGRLHSASYVPPPGTAESAQLDDAVTRLFTDCQEGGRVAVRYTTKVYYGR